MDLEIEVEVSDTLRDLSALAFDQIPFATAQATNSLAKLARDRTTAGVMERFDVKNRSYVQRSTWVTEFARKERPEATVTVRDPFLAQHEEGGVRRRGDIYSSMPQAVREREQKRPLHRSATPSAILARPKAFVRRLRSGKVGVFVRRTKKRLPIDLVYVFERTVDLGEGRLRFEETVRTTATREWSSEFGKALAKAIATARR